MKKNQNGFGLVGIIILTLVIAGAGFAGWRVFDAKSKMINNSQFQAQDNSAQETTEEKTENKEEEYVVPDGYIVYENKYIGFKFMYSKIWGTLKTRNNSKLPLDIEGSQLATNDPRYPTSLIVFADKQNKFEIANRYKSIVTLKPIKSGNNQYSWMITKASHFITQKEGEIYEPAPKMVYESGDIRVFDFSTGHASGEWTTWAFVANDFFVGLHLPMYNSMDKNQAAFPNEKLDREKFEKAILESIRIL